MLRTNCFCLYRVDPLVTSEADPVADCEEETGVPVNNDEDEENNLNKKDQNDQ